MGQSRNGSNIVAIINVNTGRPIMIRDSDHDTHLPELDSVSENRMYAIASLQMSQDEEQPWQPSPPLNVSYPPMPSRSMAAFRAQCRLCMLQPSVLFLHLLIYTRSDRWQYRYRYIPRPRTSECD